jgi:hypothetical protein
MYIPNRRTPNPQYKACKNGELVNINMMNKQNITTVITTIKADDVV